VVKIRVKARTIWEKSVGCWLNSIILYLLENIRTEIHVVRIIRAVLMESVEIDGEGEMTISMGL
jgi:hypothetical protein